MLAASSSRAFISPLESTSTGTKPRDSICTFLFVSLYDLLPEVFHHREDSLVKVLLIVAGVGAMAFCHEMGA